MRGLLDMVKDLNDVLDGYLVGRSKAADAALRLIETCRQMRARELNSAATYWLGAIEKHAGEIERSPRHSWDDGRLDTSGTFLGMQLMKDIYYLRLQLVNGRGAIH
jgi:hypothetical protein